MQNYKVQPHCMVCKKPFKRNDQVYTDSFFTQIQHCKCFIYKSEYIKDSGTFEEIVNKYPHYQKSFIIADKPITSILVKSSYRRL